MIGLAVVTPFAAWFSTLSGNNLRNRLAAQGMAPEILTKIDQHRDFGDKTLWAVLGLAVLTVLFLLVQRMWAAPAAGAGSAKLTVTIVLTVAVLGFAGASAYYVFKAGDSGARVVWGS